MTFAMTARGRMQFFTVNAATANFAASPISKTPSPRDMGRKVAGDLLRKVPLFGGALADNVAGEDPRYVYNLTADQLQAHWNQVKDRFRECPTCKKVVCISDFDEQSRLLQRRQPARQRDHRGARRAGRGGAKRVWPVPLAWAIRSSRWAMPAKQAGQAPSAPAPAWRAAPGRHAGRGGDQILPGMRHDDGPAGRHGLPKMRHGHPRRQILPELRE